MKPKFRAYSETNKDMVSWGNLLNLNVSNIFRNPEMCGMVLMQSTGLHDKNGVEIYEGDILKVRDSYLAVYVVEWHKDKFMWILRYQKDKNQYFPFYNISGPFFEDLELLGNIYENFELLEETE